MISALNINGEWNAHLRIGSPKVNWKIMVAHIENELKLFDRMFVDSSGLNDSTNTI
jgi:hypothetical protein